MGNSRIGFVKTVTVVCLAFGSSSFCNGQESQESDETKIKKFQPIDVFQLEFASDPQISPDATSIVYVRNYFDIMTDRRKSELWIVENGSAQQPLISNTQYQNASSPRWSPDGNRLIFVTSRPDGKAQIFCHWKDSGRTGVLSRLTESPSSITWSPDGRSIAFFMRVPADKEPFAQMPKKPEGAKWADAPTVIRRLRYRADGRGFLPQGFSHLFVVSADGGSPRQLTTGDYNHSGAICWRPNSQSIIFSANRREDADFQPRNSDLYEVSLADGSINQLTDRNGPDSSPAISDDGSQIAYIGFDDKLMGHQNGKLYVMNADGTGSRVLADIDRGIRQPRWCKHRKAWLFTYVDQGNTKLGIVNSGGSVQKLADNLGSNSAGRPYGGGSTPSVSDDGNMVFTTTTPERPGELTLLQPDAKRLTRVTDLNRDLIGNRTLGKVSEIRFKSSYDNQEIQGWYILPPDFDKSKKYPLILEIHGGPFADYGDRFTAELQLYASAGYVVLYLNPRGSTSYGESFANLIHHNYPGNDYDDLMSGVDAMIEKGFIDDKKMFVTGGSGGGVLTAWIVGKTDRFRAAVVAKPVINWYSFALTADMYNYFYKYWFPGLPWDHPEAYMKRSPISLVGNVKTPTMLLTGEQDFRTPMSETEQYYQALKLCGVETAMVRVPDASHGIGARPSQLIAKVVHILKWFEMHSEK